MDVEENAEKENSIELEEDRTHTEATNGSSSHATGGRKRYVSRVGRLLGKESVVALERDVLQRQPLE